MIGIKRLVSTDSDFSSRLDALLAFEAAQDEAVEQTVAAILADVRQRGDLALVDYTRRFDGLSVHSMAELEISRDQLQRALVELPDEQRQALEAAAKRVRRYHQRQTLQSWQYEEGDEDQEQGEQSGSNGGAPERATMLGQKVTPLDRVGLYVPGGKASYPSSVLMNAIPARVAGVGELIMVVPTPAGEQNPLVLAAAALVGVDRVFTIGGAQAIAALAYGTRSIPQVDKIVGPGNAYVAAAKRRVFGVVGIDMVAGPSEILIICDGHTDPDWVAMDLFSQAEHDELAQSILLCPDRAYIEQVAAALERLLPTMPRQRVIRAALENRGALIAVRDLDEACRIANRIAPEHLELSVDDADAWVHKIRHAGAIFIGRHSSESLGDYCAGPNHVLPTSGSARFSSPLGVYDFQKRSSLIRVSQAASKTLGRIAATLADGEGLPAHARAARYRVDG
ncbi:MAG: histidinol dehydrogenase [Candidatus Accumulibacter sp.]|uniref:histidinol dehydrogenase n=1 Tax=Accumulibacter sp. TaxID=2053492 RepID=UPI0025E836CC|nr:histidinol dehydrogenase [Accumulibacter sp.]MCP5248921.1 histidinol dehydrogenase [Accumulibacter sp.]